MSNLENNTTSLQNLLDKVNNLPEAGGGGDNLDAFIDGTLTEVTSNVESVRNYAFYNHIKLTSINLPSAKSIGQNVLHGCENLTTVNCPLVTSTGNSTFNNCFNLTTVYMPLLTNIGGSMFVNCYNLMTVNFPLAESIGGGAFQSCRNLKTADFPIATSIYSNAFYGCYILTSLILRSSTVCSAKYPDFLGYCYHILGTAHASYNPSGAKDGYIYVPKALIEDYKVATNWTTYASQFRALEDYTVDGTTTGALDETKI